MLTKTNDTVQYLVAVCKSYYICWKTWKRIHLHTSMSFYKWSLAEDNYGVNSTLMGERWQQNKLSPLHIKIQNIVQSYIPTWTVILYISTLQSNL